MRLRIVLLAWTAGSAAFSQEMVRIPKGTFEMADQVTTLKVAVSVSEFLMGSAEITQQQYEAVTGANPSFYKGGSRPVENVSWWDAIRYANLRSLRENLPPCYDLSSGRRVPACTGYRLPTEAEWTLAAGAPVKPEQLRESAVMGERSTKSIGVLETALAKGTAPVRSRRPSALGVYDIRGNVWEWCEDYFDPVISPSSVKDPAGPRHGLARVIRGGSFVTTSSSWSRELRSSQTPAARSRFTGFRLARSVSEASAPVAPSPDFFKPYRQPPAGFETSLGSLAPLAAGNSRADWERQAAQIRAKWEGLLRVPETLRQAPAARMVRAVEQQNFAGQLMEVEVEQDVWEKVYLLRPAGSGRRLLPVMIVPFYDVDVPAAADLGGRNYSPKGVNAFAYTAAQHGYLAVAVRWFGESYGEGYSEAVANLALRHPGSTGLGKWIADARRVVDFISTLPGADANRIGIMGHSLGGKMALYAAAFDPRIRAVVSSELGVGFAFSNYDDYWYLGEALARAPKGTDQHELIALTAPRPFLLIGGDEFDKAASWHYINAAREVYRLYDVPDNIGYFNHHTGHTPSPESVSLAFDWLDHFLRP